MAHPMVPRLEIIPENPATRETGRDFEEVPVEGYNLNTQSGQTGKEKVFFHEMHKFYTYTACHNNVPKIGWRHKGL